MTLNTDGAFKASLGTAIAGGLVRDGAGGWLKGFAYHLDICSVLCAELWGILNGIDMAWWVDYRKNLVEVDCKFAVWTYCFNMILLMVIWQLLLSFCNVNGTSGLDCVVVCRGNI